ncbi:MAG: hypothetical protein CMH38_03235 [Microbacterium sp.]|uniref:hypothetical protein n=1 Tax=Microbacterium sp. TaxID=51671 RepID=UPI000C4F70F6|nr:hypothetical protein [Microbacterium sp.]MAY48853.1 hypothetical protein [Microbacterium sp.]MAY48934.1 hypothetical protein [Microbacterium sp.]MBS69410.1 hypothetical protein [Pseudomonas sp.]|tara:strand:- start:27766 stop:27969 length:204 start_codon:yes stop_codon:yes gene_type:complete
MRWPWQRHQRAAVTKARQRAADAAAEADRATEQLRQVKRSAATESVRSAAIKAEFTSLLDAAFQARR